MCTIRFHTKNWESRTLRKKCPYSKLFWFEFPSIRTEHGKILHISPYSLRMQKNVDQNNAEYGHFLRSDSHYKVQPIQADHNILRFALSFQICLSIFYFIRINQRPWTWWNGFFISSSFWNIIYMHLNYGIPWPKSEYRIL